MRICLREPIPEIFKAAKYLDDAVTAHLEGRNDVADQLIRKANMPEIREWVESIWGKNTGFLPKRDAKSRQKAVRIKERMPIPAQKAELLRRDGYHCRFCGIPVIRTEIRKRIRAVYPDALPWGSRNIEQHAAFQAMWVQYDHLLPHASSGTNDLDNIVITCGPCNFGRMNYSLEEVGLIDPRTREPVCSNWDGLERFR
ncbi:MAG TPA: HNH endonuclease signature motif containing protein [Chthoniobacterales bacterium]|nr:HNH endonuclease signature motif containing protein [Chthoniobacterales bacterium]